MGSKATYVSDEREIIHIPRPKRFLMGLRWYVPPIRYHQGDEQDIVRFRPVYTRETTVDIDSRFTY